MGVRGPVRAQIVVLIVGLSVFDYVLQVRETRVPKRREAIIG
jgi:hypothetical protein